MNSFAVLAALVCGGLLAVQVGVNSALRVRLGHPIVAALISFLIGTIGLLLYLLVRPPGPGTWPSREMVRQGPWWIWTGGLLGAVYVASAAALAPRLGAAGWLGLIVAGQVIASMVLDHFGLVGFAVHPVNPWRLAGAALLVLGVTFVLRY